MSVSMPRIIDVLEQAQGPDHPDLLWMLVPYARALRLAGEVEAGLQALERALAKEGARVFYPAPIFCTDNGAMIAYAGAQRLAAGQVDGPDAQVRPRWPMEELPPLASGDR